MRRQGVYLVILALRTVSKQSAASLLLAKYLRTGSKNIAEFCCDAVFEVHRMQFALSVACLKLLETLKSYVAAEFRWTLNREHRFLSEDDVFADVHYRVVFDGFFWAECFAHFLLDFLRCIVDEDACVGFAL